MSEVEPRRIKKLVRKPEGLTQTEAAFIQQSYPSDELSPTSGPEPSRTPRGNASKKPVEPRSKKQHLSYALTKPRPVEGFVTLTQLASERGIQAQLARLWVIQAGLKKNGNRWAWKTDSRDLKRARKALGLST